MASSSIVRISNRTRDTLEVLSRRSGEPMLHIIDKAVESYRRHVFLEETNRAYARLRSNPEASAAFDREMAEWDATLADGLEELEPERKRKPNPTNRKKSQRQ